MCLNRFAHKKYKPPRKYIFFHRLAGIDGADTRLVLTEAEAENRPVPHANLETQYQKNWCYFESGRSEWMYKPSFM